MPMHPALHLAILHALKLSLHLALPAAAVAVVWTSASLDTSHSCEEEKVSVQVASSVNSALFPLLLHLPSPEAAGAR